MRTSLARGLTLAATAVAAACASGSGRSADDVTVLVHVENDALPASAVTLSLAPTDGSRRALGTIAPSGGRLVRLGGLRTGVEYRLTAERANGASVSSRPFILADTDLVDWTLSTNALQVLRAESP